MLASLPTWLEALTAVAATLLGLGALVSTWIIYRGTRRSERLRLLYAYEDRLNSRELRMARAEVARQHLAVPDEIGNEPGAYRILGALEDLASCVNEGQIDREPMWNDLGSLCSYYTRVLHDEITSEEARSPENYKQLRTLQAELDRLDRKNGIDPETFYDRGLAKFLTLEAKLPTDA